MLRSFIIAGVRRHKFAADLHARIVAKRCIFISYINLTCCSVKGGTDASVVAQMQAAQESAKRAEMERAEKELADIKRKGCRFRLRLVTRAAFRGGGSTSPPG